MTKHAVTQNEFYLENGYPYFLMVILPWIIVAFLVLMIVGFRLLKNRKENLITPKPEIQKEKSEPDNQEVALKVEEINSTDQKPQDSKRNFLPQINSTLPRNLNMDTSRMTDDPGQKVTPDKKPN